MSDEAPVVAVDIGGTKITAAVVDHDRVSSQWTVPTPARDGRAAIVDAVVSAIDHVRPDHAIRGIGISSAGVIDRRTGTVVAATGHLVGWPGTPLAELVGRATGVPVRVINDVQAHGLGEALFGAGRSVSSFVLIAAGTGLGGAFVIGGEVISGAHGIAGHLGHVPAEEAAGMPCACGGQGHLECVASGAGLVRLYQNRGGTAESAAEIADRAASEELARECVRTSGLALGRAVGGWSNVLDPEIFVVTGGLAQAGPVWWDSLTDSAEAEALPAARPVRIVRAARPSESALLGASSLLPSSVDMRRESL